MLQQFERYARAVSYHGGLQLQREISCNLRCGCSPVKDDDLIGLDHSGRRFPDRAFLVRGYVEPGGEISHSGGCGQRTSMYSLQQAVGCKLSQITPDSVLGEIEFMAEVFSNHLPVSAQ